MYKELRKLNEAVLICVSHYSSKCLKKLKKTTEPHSVQLVFVLRIKSRYT